MVVATGILCTLICLPLLLAAPISAPHFSLALIPVAIVVLYSSIHLALISASKTQQIIRASFWVFVYIFLGVSPFLQVLSNQFPWPGSYDEPLLAGAAFMTLLGLLAFDAGHFLLWSPRGLGVPHLLQKPLRETFIVLLAGISLLMSAYFVWQLGGPAALLLTRLQRSQLFSARYELPEMLLLVNMATTPPYVLLVALLATWVARRRRRVKVSAGHKAMALILLVTTLILNNPIGTARFKVGTILLSLFFLLPWRRWSGAATVGLLVFAVLVVFPFAALFRNSLDVRLIDQLRNTSAISALTKSGNFDAYQMIANTDSVMETTDFQLGRQIGGALLFWIPRSLWPDKPIATGQWIAEKKGYSFTNLSEPLWGEFYVDGGWLLLCLGFVGYGYLVRTLDRWYAASTQAGQPQMVSILVPIYAGYQFFLLRGALMPALAYLAPMLLFAALCGLPPKGKQVRHRSEQAT